MKQVEKNGRVFFIDEQNHLPLDGVPCFTVAEIELLRQLKPPLTDDETRKLFLLRGDTQSCLPVNEFLLQNRQGETVPSVQDEIRQPKGAHELRVFYAQKYSRLIRDEISKIEPRTKKGRRNE